METILRFEGGWSPLENKDPETLFGITDANWVEAIANLNISTQPRTLQPYLQNVVNAPGYAGKIHQTRLFMQEVGRLLDPMGKGTTQPETGAPKRSIEKPRPGLDAQQHAFLADAKELAKNILHEKYAAKTHFSEYPPELAIQVIRSSVNTGEPRALWMTVKSMIEAGIIINESELGLPELTSAEVNNKNIFARGGRGSPFASAAAFDRVADTLRNATSDQIDRAANRFIVWNITYYKELARESPRFKRYLNGWRTAANEANMLALAADASRAWDSVGSSVGKMSSTFIEGAKGAIVSYADNQFDSTTSEMIEDSLDTLLAGSGPPPTRGIINAAQQEEKSLNQPVPDGIAWLARRLAAAETQAEEVSSHIGDLMKHVAEIAPRPQTMTAPSQAPNSPPPLADPYEETHVDQIATLLAVQGDSNAPQNAREIYAGAQENPRIDASGIPYDASEEAAMNRYICIREETLAAQYNDPGRIPPFCKPNNSPRR